MSNAAKKIADLATAYDDASRRFDRDPTQANRDVKNAAAWAYEQAAAS